MKINSKNFFNKYAIEPLSPELSYRDRITALVLTILVGIVTFGICQLVAYIKLRNRIITVEKQHEIKHENFSKIVKKTVHAFEGALGNQCFPLKQEDMRHHVQHFVDNYYAQSLPKEDEVTVPLSKGEWVQWNSLTQEEKVQLNNNYALPHGQLDGVLAAKIVDSKFFTPRGQKVYLARDPRKHHGSDHAVRAAIFSQVFFYLYVKYHPDYSNASMKQMLCATLAAAAHDSARQTEGPDFYDEASAEHAVDYLQSLGIRDDDLLEHVRQSIENKESRDFKTKPLIAKCVQNADCAEFVRLLLRNRSQDEIGFENSRKYLDIYNELHDMSQGGKDFVLSNGYTYGDFLKELDYIRIEMNEFIFETHQKDRREEFSKEGNNYFAELSQEITHSKYPLLFYALCHTGLKQTYDPEQAHVSNIIQKMQVHLASGETTFSYDTLERMIEDLRELPLDRLNEQDAAWIKEQKIQLRKEKSMRQRQLSDFKACLKAKEKEKIAGLKRLEALNLEVRIFHDRMRLIKKYAQAHPAVKDEVREVFLRETQLAHGSWQSLEGKIPQGELAAVIADMEHLRLKEMLNRGHGKFAKTEKKGFAKELHEKALFLLKYLEKTDRKFCDYRIQTTCALAFEKASVLLMECGELEQARQVLADAAEKIIIDKNHPLKLIDFDKCKNNTTRIFLFDSSFIRKRRVRVAMKKIGDKEVIEFAFELPSKIRTALTQKLSLIQTADGSPIKISTVDTNYEKLSDSGDQFEDKQSNLQLGSDIKLDFLEKNASVLIGNSATYWNQYHLVRVRLEKGADIQNLHEVLSQMGLPMALMASREEDVQMEALNRIMAMRFPSIVQQGITASHKRKKRDPKDYFNDLSPAQQEQVKKDLQAIKLDCVGPHQLELVHTTLPQEAWKNGARALGVFISAGSVEQTASVLGRILCSALLSSEERYMNGILGLGCVPKFNITTGSGNQVFTRLITKNFFEKKTALNKFAIVGPILLLLDVKALERMPYSYLADRGGLRNPNFEYDLFWAEKQKPIHGFKGWERMHDRVGIQDLCKELSERRHYLNETMFDSSLGAQYINKAVVWKKEDKYTLIHTLEKMGIHDINGLPLEDAVIVGDHLDPAMIDHFEEAELPKKARETLQQKEAKNI